MTAHHSHELPDIGPTFLWAAALNTAYVVLKRRLAFGSARWPCWRCGSQLDGRRGLLMRGAQLSCTAQTDRVAHYGLGRATVLAAWRMELRC